MLPFMPTHSPAPGLCLGSKDEFCHYSRARRCGLLLLLLYGALGSACSNGKAQSDTGVIREAAPVQVAVVVERDLPIEVSAIGTVEATSTVAILPQVAGRITSVEFEEGALVKRDDPLFTIDTRPYNASLSAAQAELAKSQAQAEQARAEADRYEALARQGLASSEEVVQREADLKSTQAAIQSARAAITAANLNVQYTTLRAPIDGRTGRLLATPGNIVHPGGTEPMVVIRSLSPVKVSFNVPPKLLPQLREKGHILPLSVRVTTRGVPATEVAGELTFIDNTVDPLAGTLTLKATFPNADEVLWPGDFVDVVVVLGTERQVLVVPEAAVAEGQQGSYTYVVDAQNIAHFRPVIVRRRTDEYVVLEKGLVRDERVVTNGVLRLRDNSPVSIEPLAATSAAAQGPKP
jgi:membrane fusion protein, multidrug efflux system